MPRAKVEAVISLARGSRLLTPIMKISRGSRLSILMIPQSRPCPFLKLSPRRSITILKFRSAALLVRQVPGGKHRSRYFLDEFGGSPSPIQVLAARNVARSNKGKGLSVGERLRGRWVYAPFDGGRLRRP